MQLHHQLKDQGLDVITLNMEGQEAFVDAKTILNDREIAVTNFCLDGGDSDEALALLEADGVLPTVNLYGRDGALQAQLAGFVDDAELERAVHALLDD